MSCRGCPGAIQRLCVKRYCCQSPVVDEATSQSSDPSCNAADGEVAPERATQRHTRRSTRHAKRRESRTRVNRARKRPPNLPLEITRMLRGFGTQLQADSPAVWWAPHTCRCRHPVSGYSGCEQINSMPNSSRVSSLRASSMTAPWYKCQHPRSPSNDRTRQRLDDARRNAILHNQVDGAPSAAHVQQCDLVHVESVHVSAALEMVVSGRSLRDLY